MDTELVHGSLSALAVGGAALLSGLPAGPPTCIPVGAVILLAVASPRDIWQIARKLAGLEKGEND